MFLKFEASRISRETSSGMKHVGSSTTNLSPFASEGKHRAPYGTALITFGFESHVEGHVMVMNAVLLLSMDYFALMHE